MSLRQKIFAASILALLGAALSAWVGLVIWRGFRSGSEMAAWLDVPSQMTRIPPRAYPEEVLPDLGRIALAELPWLRPPGVVEDRDVYAASLPWQLDAGSPIPGTIGTAELPWRRDAANAEEVHLTRAHVPYLAVVKKPNKVSRKYLVPTGPTPQNAARPSPTTRP